MLGSSSGQGFGNWDVYEVQLPIPIHHPCCDLQDNVGPSVLAAFQRGSHITHHWDCPISHQQVSSGFLKLARTDFPCSHLTSQVFHGGDGAGGCRSCPGPTARQQQSQGWTQRSPRPGPRQDSPGVASAGLWARQGHTRVLQAQSPQSHRHPNAASVSPAVKKMK